MVPGRRGGKDEDGSGAGGEGGGGKGRETLEGDGG